MIKTREELHKEASEIIQIMFDYKTLKYNQVARLFPDKIDKIESIIKRLIKQKRIVYNKDDDTLSYGSEVNGRNYNYGLISAFWVLIDFLDGVEYHFPSDYPVQIAFFTNNELYEIIYAGSGRENIINHALSSQKSTQSNRIIVVDNEKQISQINADNIICFCIVNTDGTVRYYNSE